MLEKFDNKKNPFKVPENYFQGFSASIMEKLPEKENKTAKIIPLWRKAVPWVAVAAIFCGVIFSTGIIKENFTEKGGSVTESGLASTIEDDYYLFLEEEVKNSMYKEMFYN